MLESDPVKALVKHVGRGKTLARDLSRDQASEAMGRILRGEFTDAQLGAFLQALRIKETSVEELVGAALGCEPWRERLGTPQPPADRHPLVVNIAFDTARKGGVLALLGAAFLRRAGLAEPVVVWTPPTLFAEADPVARTVEALRSHAWLAEGECPMVEVDQLVPPWKGLRRLRAELGFRSILNTVEKLLRPWDTAPIVVGISHDTFSERLCHVLHALGAPKGAVVRGNHGTCDLTLGVKPMEITTWVDSDVRDVSIPMESLLEGPDGSILLATRLDDWPSLLAAPESPLWRAVRGQAALFLSVARGISLPDAVAIVATIATQGEQP